MICTPCREQRHDQCVDNKDFRLYRGCFCQHKTGGEGVNWIKEDSKDEG